MKYKRFRWDTCGKAEDTSVVISGTARFTILTDRLIRIEYDKEARFVDDASQVVFYRNFDKPKYTVEISNDILRIETEYLSLNYAIGTTFSSETLCVKLKVLPFTKWTYGEKISQLKGTTCTLDNINGETELQDGVCSRNGYTVIDDSKTLLLTDDGWFKTRESEEIDLYFFGYGHAYRDCIADFYRLTGSPPLLPDYAFGNWWSRYNKYTQQEYCDLMQRFEDENIPFSVAVVDMDWHTTEIPKESCIDHPRFWKGWTGYSWNRELFPDYKGFLDFLRKHKLKTALNLHPSNGVGCHEDMYEEMAKACGVDPKSKKLIKLNLLDPDFMTKYFDILHHPYEEDGVDFWWMDWQQGDDYWWVHDEEHPISKLEQMPPLWILNHLHILDIMRSGKRPMFFSRYCGLGAHRYPVGFSGDTITTWESLDFQPYFTATASNAGYCWWSHDIGGHMQGYRDDELQIRWLQLGVLSPINRLHSTNDIFAGKEPWNLSDIARPIAEDWLRKRHHLFPYLYTMNYRTSTELQPLIQPMYYSHPECDEAYEFKNQYWFGSEVIVAPITSKNDKCSLMGSVNAWLPKGKWIDFFNGTVYNGDSVKKVHRSLKEYPVFAKAGAIVPTEDTNGSNALGKKDKITIFVFPGADNTFRMYEDKGDGNDYKDGDFVTTEFSLKWGEKAEFKINSAKGKTDLIPERRAWTIKFRGFSKDVKIEAVVEGKAISIKSHFDEKSNTITVEIPSTSVTSNILLTLTAESDIITDNSSAKNRIFDIIMHAQISYDVKTKLWETVMNNEKYLYAACPEKEYSEVLSAVQEQYELLNL